MFKKNTQDYETWEYYHRKYLIDLYNILLNHIDIETSQIYKNGNYYKFTFFLYSKSNKKFLNFA